MLNLMLNVIIVVILGWAGQRVNGPWLGRRGQLGPQLRSLHRRGRREVDRRGAHPPANLANVFAHSMPHLKCLGMLG